MTGRTPDEHLRDLELLATYVARDAGIAVSVQREGRGYVLWTGQGNLLRAYGQASYRTLHAGLAITRRVLESMREAKA